MKTELTLDILCQKLFGNFPEFSAIGVDNLGIFTRRYCEDDDAELFVTFNSKSDFKLAYSIFSDKVNAIFPDCQISIYSERDSDNLNQSIFDEMILYY